MSSSKKTTTQSKSTRKVQVTRTVTKTGPDVSINSLISELRKSQRLKTTSLRIKKTKDKLKSYHIHK